MSPNPSATTSRDRLETAKSAPLAPDSLVGSFFNSDSERGWHGCVVAEPVSSVYLVELFDWIAGSSSHQEVVRLDQLSGWRFYDDAEWMRNSDEHDIKHEREG